MINEKVEKFLESTNMNYLFCLLSNIEINRINQLPVYVKQKFAQKITEISLEHVAENEVPDYLKEIAEAELYALEMEQRKDQYEGYGDNYEEDGEEFVDDFRSSSAMIDDDEDDDDKFDDDMEEEDYGSGFEESDE